MNLLLRLLQNRARKMFVGGMSHRGFLEGFGRGMSNVSSVAVPQQTLQETPQLPSETRDLGVPDASCPAPGRPASAPPTTGIQQYADVGQALSLPAMPAGHSLAIPGEPKSTSPKDIMNWISSLFNMNLSEFDHMNCLMDRRLVNAEQAYEACVSLGYTPTYELQSPLGVDPDDQALAAAMG